MTDRLCYLSKPRFYPSVNRAIIGGFKCKIQHGQIFFFFLRWVAFNGLMEDKLEETSKTGVREITQKSAGIDQMINDDNTLFLVYLCTSSIRRRTWHKVGT